MGWSCRAAWTQMNPNSQGLGCVGSFTALRLPRSSHLRPRRAATFQCTPASRNLPLTRLPVEQSALGAQRAAHFRVDNREIGIRGDQAIFIDGQPASRVLAPMFTEPRALQVSRA